MIHFSTSDKPCFKCKEGKFVYGEVRKDITIHQMPRLYNYCTCDKCGIKVDMSLYNGSEVDGRSLIEEAISVDFNKFSGEIEDVIDYLKELSILHDDTYLTIEFDYKKVLGLRFENDVERGKRLLTKKKNDEKDKIKKEKEQEEKKKRFMYLKKKYEGLAFP